jgi:hypothetical protein
MYVYAYACGLCLYVWAMYVCLCRHTPLPITGLSMCVHLMGLSVYLPMCLYLWAMSGWVGYLCMCVSMCVCVSMCMCVISYVIVSHHLVI